MSDLVKRLRNRTIMVNYGHGDVRDVADEDCVAAADCIDALEAENKALRETLRDCVNFMENTESELGITLSSADRARALLAKEEK